MKNKSNTIMSCFVLSGLVFLVPAGTAAFGVITSNPLLPSDTGVYAPPEHTTLEYTGAGSQISAENPLFDPLAETAVRTQIGADELETFDAVLTADFSIYFGGSLSAYGAGVLSGPASMITYNKWGVTTGMFNAEIVDMTLSGDVDGWTLLVRESPTLASLGSTTITDLGGGLYDIDSFFDVFTELSVDGGDSWIPAAGSIRMNLVPEPSTIAMLGLGAFWMSRKRRALRF